MAILKKKDLVREVVVFLSERIEHKAPCEDVYDELVKYFPDVTQSEKNARFRNSRSKWANNVQYARLHGVEQGLIYKGDQGPQPLRGVWVLTDLGIRQAQDWQSVTAVGKGLAAARAQTSPSGTKPTDTDLLRPVLSVA